MIMTKLSSVNDDNSEDEDEEVQVKEDKNGNEEDNDNNQIIKWHTFSESQA